MELDHDAIAENEEVEEGEVMESDIHGVSGPLKDEGATLSATAETPRPAMPSMVSMPQNLLANGKTSSAAISLGFDTTD